MTGRSHYEREVAGELPHPVLDSGLASQGLTMVLGYQDMVSSTRIWTYSSNVTKAGTRTVCRKTRDAIPRRLVDRNVQK